MTAAFIPPASAAVAPPPIAFGDSGATVALLQQDLRTLGYARPGDPRGIYGGQTWVNVVFFQRDQGLRPTGNANAATWSALERALATRSAGQQAPLAAGATGAAVGALQTQLAALGYSPGPVDGIFGPATLRALIAFQISRLLPPTGFVDPATSTALTAADRTLPARSVSVSSGPPAGTDILGYWAVWGNDQAAMTSLARHGTDLAWLCPFWYTLLGDGTLRSRENDHAAVIAAAAASHDPVLAMINDGSGVQTLLSDAAGRRLATGAVAAMLAANPGLTGVMIDFESLPPSSGSDLTAFVAELRATLPAADLVGVAVGPKVSANETGEGLYQYAALGAVADLVQVMTYDDHNPATAPGPVAPIGWATRVADFAASVIPPNKILLGVPAYGYDWSATGAASSISVAQAFALAQSHGITPVLNATSAADTFTYTDRSGTGHTVWFESPAAVAAMRSLAIRLGLRGLAVWTLGGDSPAFWSALTSG